MTKKTEAKPEEPLTMAQAAPYQHLRGHLAQLKLTAAAEQLPNLLDQARSEKFTLTAALERLVSLEVDADTSRRLAGRTRFACLPTPARLADQDFDAAPGVDRHLIEDLVTCRYLECATNVLLMGTRTPIQ